MKCFLPAERIRNHFFKNPSFAALVRRFFETPEDADAQRQLQDWVGKYPAHDDYDQRVCRLGEPIRYPSQEQ